MKEWITQRWGPLWLLFFLPGIAGCLQTRVSEPRRTAVEQLLLSTAADRSLQRVHWDIFEEKKVFVIF